MSTAVIITYYKTDSVREQIRVMHAGHAFDQYAFVRLFYSYNMSYSYNIRLHLADQSMETLAIHALYGLLLDTSKGRLSHEISHAASVK